MLMQDQRNIILWTAIALYAASIVTCIVAVVRARKDRVPWMGPESAAYLNPLANLFLGAGFLISALANNALWLRALFCAAGLLVFVVVRNRARKKKLAAASRNIDPPSN
jgi:hypothetical protein